MLNHKGLAKDHLGQVLSQPCWDWKLSFCCLRLMK